MGNPELMLLTLSLPSLDEKCEQIEARHVCPGKVDLLCDSLLERPKKKVNSKKVTKKAPEVVSRTTEESHSLDLDKDTSKKQAAISPGTPEVVHTDSASVKKKRLLLAQR